MAGKGTLAYHLSKSLNIKATDDKSWKINDTKGIVEPLSAIDAIKKYKDEYDILIMVWPPNADASAYNALKEWGSDKPVIFCGEMNGCTGDEDFFDHFYATELPVRYVSLPGLYDKFYIGRYSPEPIP